MRPRTPVAGQNRAGARSALIFCDYPGEVEATNNGSERKLRPCVIQRKVTNGYRAMWAPKAEADVRTTVDTARLKGATPSRQSSTPWSEAAKTAP